MSIRTFGFSPTIAVVASGIIGFATLASAQEMPMPQGVTVLTVSGDIENTNVDDTAVFDIEMLRALPQTTIRTSTIWTDGEQEFVGVELATLLEFVGANGESLQATAINDYSIEFPTADALPGGALVAYENNGKQMTVRNKGPLWVVFPYDSSPDFQTEVVYSRSIWQLDRLEILE